MLTLAQIAKETGVCKATVSLILNGKAKQNHISDATVEKIQAYCRKVNYMPNIHAVRMNKKIVGNIMVLLNTQDGISRKNSFTDYNVAQIVGGIAQEAEKVGYTFQIRIFNSSLDENSVFNSFRNREVDGMIYYGMRIPQEWLNIFREEKRKVVGIGVELQSGISTVNINNRDISNALTEELIAAGYHNFLYLSGTEESFPGRERFAGFLSALEKYKIKFPKNKCLYGGFHEELAMKVVTEYLKKNSTCPDAIVCANDRMAIGVISALKTLHLKIPEQIAVAGGDNIEIGRYLTPSLVTFDNLPEQMGIVAFQLLYNKINGRETENDILLESRLIQGDSA